MADMPDPLRLLAEDADDLSVISAALQDAVARIGDIAYEKASRRLTLAFNRYRWEQGGERVRCGLQLGSVLAVRPGGCGGRRRTRWWNCSPSASNPARRRAARSC